MNLRINAGFNFLGLKPANNNSSRFRLNSLKADTFSAGYRKEKDDNIYGADYSILNPSYTKRTKIIPELVQDNMNGIDISEDRDALILSRVKTATKQAKAFIQAHPQFDYNDICQDLITIIIDCTDKELSGESSVPAPIEYANRKNNYFKQLLIKNSLTAPFEDKYLEILRAEEDEKVIDESKTEELLKELNKYISKLNPRTKAILEYYYGLNGQNPSTLEKTGEKFNLCKESVRRVIAGAERFLRHPARRALDDMLVLNEDWK